MEEEGADGGRKGHWIEAVLTRPITCFAQPYVSDANPKDRTEPVALGTAARPSAATSCMKVTPT